MICKHILLITSLNKLELNFLLHTVKCFQVLLCNNDNLTSVIYLNTLKEISLSVISFLNELELISLNTSISFVSTQLNGFTYCYITFIILIIITPLFVELNSSKYCYV